MDHLHVIARDCAEKLRDPDKKQLRFNEIVEAAQAFYPASVDEGVRELVEACDKSSRLYVRKAPMWQVLREQYGWML